MRDTLWLRPIVSLLFSSMCSQAISSSDGTNYDASDVTWSHATNSRILLEEALKGNKTFLEADVSWGNLVTNESFHQAIMAHPPDNVSDISLDQWLKMVVEFPGPRKAIKLDFKTYLAFEAALPILENHTDFNPDNLWLNADIVKGPWNAPDPIIPAEKFVVKCSQIVSTLSPGWTTTWDLYMDKSKFRYSWQDVWLMVRTLACAEDKQTGHIHGITFPVRAIFVGNSVPQLIWLLAVTGDKSSLTVWSNILDFSFNADDLLSIRRAIPEAKVYYDLPECQEKEFLKIKNNVTYQPIAFEPEDWAVLRTTTSPFGCDEKTYVTPGVHILRGGGREVAVVYNKILTFPLTISGRLRPYELADYNGNYTERDGAVSILLADNRSYWDKDWRQPDMSKTVLAFGISNPDSSFSDCYLDWRITVARSDSPIEITTDGSCAVDVTKGNFTLPENSTWILGFVFTGPRALVLEGVSVGASLEEKHVWEATHGTKTSGVSRLLNTFFVMITTFFNIFGMQ